MKKLLFITTICLIFSEIRSQDKEEIDTLRLEEIVVTASRFNQALKNSGKAVYQLSRKEIESLGPVPAGVLLDLMPGMYVTGGYGPLGTDNGYFSRGLSREHNMILIDGIPSVDPSLPNASFDLRHLSSSNIEEVELLQNGMSTLYGTGASGSVINFRTKTPDSEELEGVLELGYGSFNTVNSRMTLGKKLSEDSYIQFNGGLLRSNGFSSARDTVAGLEFDDDGYLAYDLNLKGGRKISDFWKVQGGASYNVYDFEYDNSGYQDSDNSGISRLGRIFLRNNIFLGNHTMGIDAGYTQTYREFFSDFPFNSRGRDIYLDANHRFDWKDWTMFSGINWREMSVSGGNDGFIETQATLLDFYSSFNGGFGPLKLNGGARLNTNSNYDNKLVGHINPSLIFDSESWLIRLFGQYSTAYLAPTPMQTNGFGGNVNLLPESTEQWEAGFSGRLEDWTLNLTYYNRFVTDKIIFDPLSFELINVDGNRHYTGWETQLSFIRQKISGNLSYSNVNGAENSESVGAIPITLRIPSHQFKLMTLFQLLPSLSTAVTINHVRQREDINFTDFSLVELDPYTLLNVSANYTWQRLKTSVQIRNILNQEYTQVFGFNTAGINFMLNAAYRIGNE